MVLELYIILGGLFSRRVLIYLAEKNLLDWSAIKLTPMTTTMSLKMVVPSKPSSTVPILAPGDGTFIKQLISIIEYF